MGQPKRIKGVPGGVPRPAHLLEGEEPADAAYDAEAMTEDLIYRFIRSGMDPDLAERRGRELAAERFGHDPFNGELQVRLASGHNRRGLPGLDELAREENERLRLLEHGPDPKELLRKALRAVGITGDAAELYVGRIVRTSDGGIRYVPVGGNTPAITNGDVVARAVGDAVANRQRARDAKGNEQLLQQKRNEMLRGSWRV